MNNKPKISLFQQWTRAYFINLLIGLLIIVTIAVLWVKHTTKEERLEQMQTFAQELALQIVDADGRLLEDYVIDQQIKSIQRVLQVKVPIHVMVADSGRKKIFPMERPEGRPPINDRLSPREGTRAGLNGPPGEPHAEPLGSVLQGLLRQMPQSYESKVSEQTIAGYGKSYFVYVPILHQGQWAGEILLGMTDRDAARLTIQYPLMISLSLGMLLLGWGTIYLLTRRLVRPILEVAKAANAMREGHYEIMIKSKIKEKEVFDMLTAIQTMALRLKHLESLRTLLLAGVTHELKTPIASISGLVQAVRDDIVHGEEKKEFLNLSIQESQRLQRMVEDLLDFNGFATGALKAEPEKVELFKFITEVVHQWQMANEKHKRLSVDVKQANNPRYVWGDPLRIQQIVVNVLNNAFYAMREDGSLEFLLYAHGDSHAGIDVKDNGQGIPEEEQPYIFERFYRGDGKKYKVRGLGLGLPFSLMLARAQGGDLYLKETSPEGTVFTLTLPLNDTNKCDTV